MKVRILAIGATFVVAGGIGYVLGVRHTAMAFTRLINRDFPGGMKMFRSIVTKAGPPPPRRRDHASA